MQQKRLKGEEGLLGRDKDKSFLKFLSAKDNAASRIVRHSAEVLGSRGGLEKTGVARNGLPSVNLIMSLQNSQVLVATDSIIYLKIHLL